MGKLVRTVAGHMVDLAMDIRQGSPWFGKIIAYDMPSSAEDDVSQWIWVPGGFAHGNFFPQPTTIEYLCTAEYSPGCEAGIAPLAADLDWSLCDPRCKGMFDCLAAGSVFVSEKDRAGFTLKQWSARSAVEQLRLRPPVESANGAPRGTIAWERLAKTKLRLRSPLPPGLVKQHGRGRGNVQTVGRAQHRQADRGRFGRRPD